MGYIEKTVKNVKERVMGRAIDMEASIDKINAKIDRIEPALEKVINWIAEQENKDDSKNKSKSTTAKKPSKAVNKVSDVQESVEH